MKLRRLVSLSFAAGALIVAAGCSSAPAVEEHTDRAEDALSLAPITAPVRPIDVIWFGITPQQRNGIGRIFHTGVLMGLAEADINYGDVVSENSALGYAQTSVPDTRWAISAPGYSWPPIAPISPSYGTVVGWRSSLHTSIARYSTYSDYYDFGVWLGFAEVDCAHGAMQNCLNTINGSITIGSRLTTRAAIGVDVLRDIRDDALVGRPDIARRDLAEVRQRYEDVVYATAEFVPNRCVFPTIVPTCNATLEGYAFMVAPGTRCPILDVPSLNARWYPDTGLPIENGKGPFGAPTDASSMVTPSKFRDSSLCAYSNPGLRSNATFTSLPEVNATKAVLCQGMAPHTEVNFSATAYLMATESAHGDCWWEPGKVEGTAVWHCPTFKGGCDTCVR